MNKAKTHRALVRYLCKLLHFTLVLIKFLYCVEHPCMCAATSYNNMKMTENRLRTLIVVIPPPTINSLPMQQFLATTFRWVLPINTKAHSTKNLPHTKVCGQKNKKVKKKLGYLRLFNIFVSSVLAKLGEKTQCCHCFVFFTAFSVSANWGYILIDQTFRDAAIPIMFIL